MIMRHVPVLTGMLLLAACGSGSGDGVGGVSASEASALNDAAAMLDEAHSGARSDVGINPAATAAARADRKRTAPDNQATGQ